MDAGREFGHNNFMRPKKITVPPLREQTLLMALRRSLAEQERPASVRELSGRLRAGERDILDALGRLRCSLAHSDTRLRMQPAVCQTCGFVFAKRERPGKPGKCPRCHGTHIEPPLFFLYSSGNLDKNPGLHRDTGPIGPRRFSHGCPSSGR